mmetsp:Transcript_50223/g.61613  ORF Transcript_50223/g.61613 Transcript_50223/m.61613 type:complete len:265 (-) Transcript_50223:354-1148(-)
MDACRHDSTEPHRNLKSAPFGLNLNDVFWQLPSLEHLTSLIFVASSKSITPVNIAFLQAFVESHNILPPILLFNLNVARSQPPCIVPNVPNIKPLHNTPIVLYTINVVRKHDPLHSIIAPDDIKSIINVEREHPFSALQTKLFPFVMVHVLLIAPLSPLILIGHPVSIHAIVNVVLEHPSSPAHSILFTLSMIHFAPDAPPSPPTPTPQPIPTHSIVNSLSGQLSSPVHDTVSTFLANILVFGTLTSPLNSNFNELIDSGTIIF